MTQIDYIDDIGKDTSDFIVKQAYAVNKAGRVLKYRVSLSRPEHDNVPCTILMESGQLGGKMKPKSKKINKGKNLGKANATTAYSQAISELESLFTKKLQEGYKTFDIISKMYFNKTGMQLGYENDGDVEIAFKELGIRFNTDNNNRTKPMLAEKFKDFKTRVKFPMYIQPKYNGIRCKAINENGVVVLLTREGTVLDIPHLTSALQGILPIKNVIEDDELDGEIYSHGLALQDIVSLARTPMLSGELKYMVYDLASGKRQDQRLALAEAYCDQAGDSVIFSETKLVYSEEEAMDYFAKVREQGYEGAILRDPKATYMFGFRDKCLLKIKGTISDEFLIVNVNLKDGSPAHDFVWVCENAFGKRFEVKPHGTVEERIAYYEMADMYFGKKLQLEFHEYTKDRIPFHVTSVTIRDYE